MSMVVIGTEVVLADLLVPDTGRDAAGLMDPTGNGRGGVVDGSHVGYLQ